MAIFKSWFVHNSLVWHKGCWARNRVLKNLGAPGYIKHFVKHPCTELKGNPGLRKTLWNINGHQISVLALHLTVIQQTLRMCFFLTLVLKWCNYFWWCQLAEEATMNFSQHYFSLPMPKWSRRTCQKLYALWVAPTAKHFISVLDSRARKGPSLVLAEWAPLGTAGRACNHRTSELSGMQRGDREQKMKSIYL